MPRCWSKRSIQSAPMFDVVGSIIGHHIRWSLISRSSSIREAETFGIHSRRRPHFFNNLPTSVRPFREDVFHDNLMTLVWTIQQDNTVWKRGCSLASSKFSDHSPRLVTFSLAPFQTFLSNADHVYCKGISAVQYLARPLDYQGLLTFLGRCRNCKPSLVSLGPSRRLHAYEYPSSRASTRSVSYECVGTPGIRRCATTLCNLKERKPIAKMAYVCLRWFKSLKSHATFSKFWQSWNQLRPHLQVTYYKPPLSASLEGDVKISRISDLRHNAFLAILRTFFGLIETKMQQKRHISPSTSSFTQAPNYCLDMVRLQMCRYLPLDL